ncbi:MAG TPA: heme ABC transporter ATP-binding protein, partial [Microbacterium ginsengisoli]|nr:heme ABC transporter ATP-binding protein [Microbacterium ginsengisoli]
NGAGKSTLMNVLYGLYQADEGEILLDDEVQHFRGPGDAMRAGIGMVHQHFMLIPVFTVAENVMLGHEETKGLGTLDLAKARARVREIADRFGFDVDPDARVEDLPVGVQQRVEIIKALSRNARVLVFDEPTAVLTPQETDELMAIMRQLRDEGTSIVFITHKLREVREVADRITVVRLGTVVGEASPTASNAELASMMVGRAVELRVQKDAATPGEGGLAVRDLRVIDPAGVVVVDDVSFDVRPGEVLAIAGVQGNGQTELSEAIVGLQARVTGSVRLGSVELVGKSVRGILDEGVGFVPEDRTHDGLVGSFSVAENLILDRSADAAFSVAGTIRRGALDRFARDRIAEFDIRTQGPQTRAGALSGGNQQKVVLAKWLATEPTVLIIDEPTRGIDVGTKSEVHRLLSELAGRGMGILMISSELPEVLGMADRVLVMREGRLTADIARVEATSENVMHAATHAPEHAR